MSFLEILLSEGMNGIFGMQTCACQLIVFGIIFSSPFCEYFLFCQFIEFVSNSKHNVTPKNILAPKQFYLIINIKKIRFILLFLFNIQKLKDSQMSNPLHIITNIKRQINEAQQTTYTQINQKKQLKFYSLYLKQIITIQRSFRSYLLNKNKKLEDQIYQQLQIRKLLSEETQHLDYALKHAQMKTVRVRNSDIQGTIESKKQNIENNLRNALQNVMNSADNFAQNSAISRLYLTTFKKDLSEEQQLATEVKELRLEQQCHIKRICDWKQKLKVLRRKVAQQNCEIKQLERSLALTQ